MNRNIAILAICFCATTVFADVDLWEGDPNDVTVVGDNIRIDAAGTFKFQAEVTPGGTLDAIGEITVNSGVTGTVYVARSTGGAGATNVGSINLTNDQGTMLTGNLAELQITGNLNTIAASTVRNVTGPIVVAGNLANAFSTTLDFNGDLTAATVSADINIGRNLGSSALLDIGTMSYDVNVTQWLLGDIEIDTFTGNLSIGGNAARSYPKTSVSNNIVHPR